MKWVVCRILIVVVVGLCFEQTTTAADDDLRFWLENMIWHHRYSMDEMTSATGLSRQEIERAVEKFNVRPENAPKRKPTDPLLVLPYPGGRHPRIGFLEGAIRPMRGTKFSVFLTCPNTGYIVVDLPEAIWSNLGLTFLAHTHIPTIWDHKGQALKNIDWTRKADAVLEHQRTLPNGIAFGARVAPQRDVVEMELWIKNGTDAPLSKLRSQICIMLKGAPDFNAQTKDNKILSGNLAAVRSRDGRRWILIAWDRGQSWANPQVPCLHSDPHFPDCEAGGRVSARGRIMFYEGDHAQEEIERLTKTENRRDQP